MDWLAPDDLAWQHARERELPVVLWIDAQWCPFSARFREHTLRAPEVLGPLSQHFVCIHVDEEQHPDWAQRFGGAGWPTLALASNEGHAIDQMGPLSPDACAARLHHWKTGSAAPANVEDQTFSNISQDVMQRLLESADPQYGGWGQRQKFPHPEALHFALVRWSREGDEATLRLVTKTLQHMQAGAIHDRVDGGFFRYARTPDWSHPQFQKMLGSNAQRLLAYAEAYQALGTNSFRETAEGIYGWMQRTLLDEPTGAYRASQDEDPEYYHLTSAAARAKRSAPPTDPLIYTDRNADAVCALLKAGLAFENDAMTERALGALDFLLAKLYLPGKGVAHAWDGKANQFGLLQDQAALLRAMTWAMHSTGRQRYLKPALELARATLAAHGSDLPEHQRPQDGSLADQLHNVQARGSVGERPENLRANAQFAEALLRLSAMAQAEDLRAAARRILTAFQSDWPRFGHSIADYGRAVDLLVHEPVQATIIGPRHGDLTRELRRRALGPYVASRVVQTLDPSEDREALAALGWPVPTDAPAVAYLHQGGRCYARTSDPQQVPALMARLGG